MGDIEAKLDKLDKLASLGRGGVIRRTEKGIWGYMVSLPWIVEPT